MSKPWTVFSSHGIVAVLTSDDPPELVCVVHGKDKLKRAHLIAASGEMREALIQAGGALRLDAMVDEGGEPYGTTVIALDAISAALKKARRQGGSEGDGDYRGPGRSGCYYRDRLFRRRGFSSF